ncbi:winged helix-turn-helix domain-containing protein [Catellatospora citrea]|uniref:OmpR/PhoB-type domain-containing protein n=1 Tax=Catellatospora citrea TaxID=53366 RepID=A0A8J3KQ64_9ACTN|nr:winged helix-turn-helix domain-containing protein [Catellatospora citrea]RKE10690.1 transcriptional regulator [Catellatospora citrea]GIG01176.1 hypothetical protein Cci01nite_62690 [Catellatospora citrea]
MTDQGGNRVSTPSAGDLSASAFVIAVAPSPTARTHLADLLEGVAPLLLVEGMDELRLLLAESSRIGTAASEPESVDLAAESLTVDATRPTARWRDREVGLTRREYDLLVCLTSEPIRVWSYAELQRTVWHAKGRTPRAGVPSLVKRLRRKLRDLGAGVTIDAVWGVGLVVRYRSRPLIRLE